MSLDPPMTEAQILTEAQRRGARVVGTAMTPVADDPTTPFRPAELGPDSPLRATKSTRPRNRRADLEHPIQAEVIAWADDPATLPEYPEIKMLYAIPNAGGSGKSKRQRQLEGARKRAEGLRAGMPDLCLPCPRCASKRGPRIYGALYLEMKTESGAVRKAQRERIAQLRAAGNRCEVAMSADAAKAIITMYLQLSRP